MASNTYEMIHIFVGLYHKDWMTIPMDRKWFYTMTVFCLLGVMVDVACISTAYFVIDVMVKYGQTDRDLGNMQVAWGLVILDWCIEVIVGFCLAIKRRGQVTALVSISVTNILFTAMQYGTLQIATYSTLLQMTGVDYAVMMRDNPALRCFAYLSMIQGISYGLSTYLMVIWCDEKYIRGGNLFLSVLGIVYACKVGAYKKRNKISENWAIILVRSVVYSFVVVLLLGCASLLLDYFSGVNPVERANFLAFFVFAILAATPFLVAVSILLLFCICIALANENRPRTTTTTATAIITTTTTTTT